MGPGSPKTVESIPPAEAQARRDVEPFALELMLNSPWNYFIHSSRLGCTEDLFDCLSQHSQGPGTDSTRFQCRACLEKLGSDEIPRAYACAGPTIAYPRRAINSEHAVRLIGNLPRVQHCLRPVWGYFPAIPPPRPAFRLIERRPDIAAHERRV